ncbi:MAG: sugar ABC transporter permease [Bacillota bacterium]
MSMDTRRALTGIVFVLPFVIGFIAFFLYPFILSLMFSFSDVSVGASGYELTSVGLENYESALLVHESYVRTLTETVQSMLANVPAILIFSLFVAVLLNQPFRGRGVARVVFFLPVIFNCGAVLLIENYDFLTNTLTGGSAASPGSEIVTSLFYGLKLPQGVLGYIMNAVRAVPDIIKASGIQILVFLAGLQSVPESLYEASAIEGATGWETFWKVTFPIISPLIPTMIVYTVIDSFTAPNNRMMELIQNTAFRGMG